MLQFNTFVYTKYSSQLWRKLDISLIKNAATIAKSANKHAIKNKEKKHIEQDKNFVDLKTQLETYFRLRSIPNTFKKAENMQHLVDLSTTLSPVERTEFKALINMWNNGDRDILSKMNLQETYGILSTSAMIKEISQMSKLKQRNIPLLKYLFDHIYSYSKVLDIKQCMDLMRSMSSLNFSDWRLLGKICHDIQISYNCSDSLVYLVPTLRYMTAARYKNNDFLEFTCKAILQSIKENQVEHVLPVLKSLALLGYKSNTVNEIVKMYVPLININQINKPILWLDFVWSLVVLDEADSKHVSTVLEDTFIARIKSEKSYNLILNLKLLNINAYAKYILKDYSGPFINCTIIPLQASVHQQTKKSYIDELKITLTSLTPSRDYFKMNVDTYMGFYIDAVLYLDSENRIVLEKDIQTNFKRVAIIFLDYHKMCLSSLEPIGIYKFYERLLNICKYHVLFIPVHHFDIRDKLIKRAKYIEDRLWTIFKNNKEKEEM